MFKIQCFTELCLASATEVVQWEILSFCIVYIITDCATLHKYFGLIQWYIVFETCDCACKKITPFPPDLPRLSWGEVVGTINTHK